MEEWEGLDGLVVDEPAFGETSLGCIVMWVMGSGWKMQWRD